MFLFYFWLFYDRLCDPRFHDFMIEQHDLDTSRDSVLSIIY